VGIIGIITGDIVNSRSIPVDTKEKLYKNIKTFLNKLKQDGWITSYELFRGDSFQCLLENITHALRVTLMIKCFIKSYLDDTLTDNDNSEQKNTSKGYNQSKYDIRLATGIGSSDFTDKGNLAHSDGEAFYLAGDALDYLKKQPFKMMLVTYDSTFNTTIEPTILLLDAVIEKWTDNQAEAVMYKLLSKKEDEIAQLLGVSQSAINQRTKTSQWFAIEKLLLYFENKINDL
jgi:hypothetical protein